MLLRHFVLPLIQVDMYLIYTLKNIIRIRSFCKEVDLLMYLLIYSLQFPTYSLHIRKLFHLTVLFLSRIKLQYSLSFCCLFCWDTWFPIYLVLSYSSGPSAQEKFTGSY